jgi:hypothetical protein
MANVATKRKKRGKSDHDGTSRRGRSARGTAAAEFPEVPLVVTPEAASRGRVSTPSLLEPTPRNLSSQLTTTQCANLSTALYAESSASITKSTSSGVKKSAEYIDFCDSAQVKNECLKYTTTATGLPSDQQTQISFLLNKFKPSAISTAFSMLIGKVGGSAPMVFFPLPSKKKELIEQFLCLIYDTKSMMINTELECYRYVKKYIQTMNILYFVICHD